MTKLLRRLIIFGVALSFVIPQAFGQQSDEQVLAAIDRVPAPPKSINDLVKLLDAAKPDFATIKKNQELLEAKEPENATQEQLWLFYRNRVKASEELSLPKQMMAACQKEIIFAGTSDFDRLHDAYMNCIQAEFNDGNVLGALKKLQDAVKSLPGNARYGRHLTYQMLMINAYRVLGDFEQASDSMRQVDSLMVVLKAGKQWSEFGDNWIATAERARGEYQMAAGKSVAAELSFVRAIEALDRKIKKIDSGHYEGGARRTFDKNRSQFARAIMLQRLGLSLMNQRKLIEAEYHFRLSLKTFLSVGSRNSIQVAGVLNNLAFCVAEQARGDEALLLSKYALQVLTEAGVAQSSTNMVYARRAHVAALVNLGQYKEALEQFKLMRAALESDPLMKDRLKNFSDLDEVIAYLYIGQPVLAEALIKDMYQINLKRVGSKHPRTVLTQAFYAMSLQDQGRTVEAKQHFLQSLPLLVDQARNDSENQTTSLKAQKRFAMLVESYIAALFSEAKSNEAVAKELIAEAFKYADMARGSSVQRALTQSTARLNIKDPKLEKLARKEQDIQRRINSLSELLVSLSAASPDRQLPGVQAKMKEDIETLKLERSAVKKEIEQKYPEYFDLVEPKPITVARTAKTLKDHEVLVTWYFGDRHSYVWAIHSSGIANYAQLPVTKNAVAKDVEKLRKSLDPGVSSVDDIPPFDVALSYRLYTQLIKPIESSLHQKRLLISIPHASLGQLPISTLLTEPMKQPGKGASGFLGYQQAPWLMRKIAVSQLPSVNALAALRSLNIVKPEQQSFIAFADPIFSKQQANVVAKSVGAIASRGAPLKLRNAPKTSKVSSAELALLPPLPDTSLEVSEIAKVLGVDAGNIFTREKASVKQVLATDFSHKSIVMFSTHGLVPGELDGLVQPALALSNPEVTGETETDGLLTMDKILELKLNADWVVLSACNTASADGDSEALSGLGRAFFYAGARALLVSNWPVDTVASRQLMTDLFKKQQLDKAMSKPEALRQAMLELADKGGYREGKSTSMSYAYAHPLFWAPFVVVGD